MDSNTINQSYIAWISYIILMIALFYVKLHRSLWNILFLSQPLAFVQVFILEKYLS